MEIELTRFKVKEGKSKRVDEWLKFLNDNMDDVLVALEGEKMYVETIFREHLNIGLIKSIYNFGRNALIKHFAPLI